MLFYPSTGDFDMTAEVDGSAGGGGAMFSFTKGLTSMPGVVLVLMEGVLGLSLSVSASWLFSQNFCAMRLNSLSQLSDHRKLP